MAEIVSKTWRARRTFIERMMLEKVYETEISDGMQSARGRGRTRRESQIAAERNWLVLLPPLPTVWVCDLLPAMRLQSVDYLRGIAAVAVMWFHLTRGIPEGFFKASGSYGYLGIAVFFVISGFVIPYSMKDYRLRDGGRFFFRRIIRLEPPYLMAVAITAALFYASSIAPGFRGQPWPTAWYDLALHPAYLVPWLGGHWANPVFWTLAIEFQYYVAMLLLAPLLLSAAPWPNRVFLAGVIALSFASSDPRTLLLYLPLFGFGFVAFLAFYERLTKIELSVWALAMTAVCAFTLGPSFAAAGLASCMALLVEWPRDLRMLGFLGAISYSLYLLHVPIGGRVINLATRLPETLPVQLAALALACSLAIMASWLLWRAVERPPIRMSRSIAQKPISTPVAVNGSPGPARRELTL